MINPPDLSRLRIAVPQQGEIIGNPAWIGEGSLEKVADGPATADAINRAISVEPLQNIRLEPDLNRLRFGNTAGSETAAVIARIGMRTGQCRGEWIDTISPNWAAFIKRCL